MEQALHVAHRMLGRTAPNPASAPSSPTDNRRR
jgi:hypothetical protein